MMKHLAILYVFFVLLLVVLANTVILLTHSQVHSRLVSPYVRNVGELRLAGDLPKGGDLYEGKLWLASPEYTSIPDEACWVVVDQFGNLDERCASTIGGISMVIEDIRMGPDGALWAIARYDTSYNPAGDVYILQWSGTEWNIKSVVSRDRWNAHRVNALVGRNDAFNARQGQIDGNKTLGGARRVTFNARHLYETSHRIAYQSEHVFQGDGDRLS